ncbi:hypothetical protein AWB78_01359 [Caballeronia calidae]|uniref:Uncharacterized protein n=1 Tax=Caballeronia calidae TaxID=1777139 RepID=A0A158A7P0_9BURK|nr:hypothetical protein AWB78_01359 [Caballeronia calidae]
MRVHELIEALKAAHPDSVVLFLETYADVAESDEISHVHIPEKSWLHETGFNFGQRYELRLPIAERGDVELERTDVVQRFELVVVLSNGPTNLRYVCRPVILTD